MLGQKDQPPKLFGGSLGPMAAATPASLSLMDLDGPALIVAQNTFARHIRLDSKGMWEIKDQYNSGRSSAQIQGAAALDADGDGKKEIVLLDRPSKSLLFLTLKDGVYRPAGNLSVGSLAFEGMHVADFDGDGRDDLLIAGSDRFGVLQTGRKGQRLKEIASYETKRNEARLVRPGRRRPERRRRARRRLHRHRRAVARDRQLSRDRPTCSTPSRSGCSNARSSAAPATSPNLATSPPATSTATAATTWS